MAPGEVDLQKLHALASMSADELGATEEDVKIHFVVPLLHALGHTRLRFEHKGMDIVIKDGLPRGSSVAIEGKRPGVFLDTCLAQLERYSLEERSLLSLLTNGRKLRIYAPFWNRARTFPETLLWEFERADLAEDHHANAIASLLAREALVGRWTLAALQQRESAIESVWAFAEALQQQDQEFRRGVHSRVLEIDRQIAQLQAERVRAMDGLASASPRTLEKIRARFLLGGVPIIPAGEFSYLLADDIEPEPPEPEVAAPAAQASRPLRAWSDEDLYENATSYQRKILHAFVSLGRRSAGIKDLARKAGLRPRSASGALSGFLRLPESTGRPPLLHVERRRGKVHKAEGHLFTIDEAYWPLIQRLYHNEAP